MGLFDFFRSAGPDLFSGRALSEVPNPGKLIKEYLAKTGFNVERIHVWKFGDDDGVEVAGWAPDKATKEKIIVSVGNLKGVGSVNDTLAVGTPPPLPPKPVVTATAPVALQAEAEEPKPELLPTPAEVEQAAFEFKTYTVEKGDTLSKIAKAMYGNANKYPVIFEANKPMLKDPDKIYPGQVLRIPPL